MPIKLFFFLCKRKTKFSIKEKIYLLKIILIIIGLIMKYHIDNSNSFKWIKEELLIIKGIKLYSIFKIIEYILLLTNKFGYDLDLQLLSIIYSQKIKSKIFSIVIYSIFLYSNIYIITLFYYCNWLIITDENKSFFPIYLKVNYIEFKQSNKSFKSIHNYLSNDIHDRFLNYFVLFFISLNCYLDENINDKSLSFKKILVCFFSEFFYDYLKGIIIFKISNINSKNIKIFLKEEIAFYNNLKNKEKNDKENYCFLKNTIYDTYSDNIELENIFPMVLNINIFPFCVIFLNYFSLKINIFFVFKIILFSFLICLKKFNDKMINYFKLSIIKKNDKSNTSKSESNNGQKIVEKIKRE